ncbi:MAG: glycosyltransferase [Prolixibacteraceae bacterium]|jgi:glycosyltransferase involved in cell wall biosynthesis|nr:glycosyltransferase [Prolixibacteraceae bacterium]
MGPLVSICCLTYNHEPYIKQCLDGFLMQKTNFPFEILIHDDASVDNTQNIIKNYELKHSDIIKPIYQKENQYSKGIGVSRVYQFPRAKGKYIAMCEGDDYWIDPYKLQKQVDFLETHPEYVFSFHDSIILNQRTGEKRMRIGDRQIDNTVDLKSLIIQKNIPTASIVFRNFLDYAQLPDWIGKISNGDYGLCVLLAEEGPGKYLPEAMSVYRIHEGGVWSSKGFEFTHSANIIFYKYLLDYFTDSEIRQAIRTKMQWSEFNYGISKIRDGGYFKGLLLVIKNVRLHGDYRLRTNPIKIASAFKTLLKRISANR